MTNLLCVECNYAFARYIFEGNSLCEQCKDKLKEEKRIQNEKYANTLGSI